METTALVAAKTQEYIDFLNSLPDAACQELNVDILQYAEQAKRTIAALQAKAARRLSEQREAEEARLGVPPAHRCKGLEAELGLARRESTYVGARLKALADTLFTVLPHPLRALQEGRVSECHARIVADETLHLSDADRQAIDAAVAHRLGKASTWQLRKLIEGHAYRLDRAAAHQRHCVA